MLEEMGVLKRVYQYVFTDETGVRADGENEVIAPEFHGKNADLNKLLQQQDEITAVVDVTRIRTAKSYTMSYDLNLPNSVQDALR
jgi:hypothetical protein